MSNLANKRRARMVAINSVRRIFDQGNNLMIGGLNEGCLNELTSLKNTAIDKYLKITEFDCDISSLIEVDEELEQEEISSTEFTIFYKRSILGIEDFINKNNVDYISSNKFISKTVKLPALKLEIFDGKQENWQTFYENFDWAINKNTELSDIQKMTYLRNLVKGQALSAITELTLSNENYSVALNILKNRFSNKQLLISIHMKKLSPEKVKDVRNISELRKMFDTIEIQIRSLENLSVDENMYGSILIPNLLEKLPEVLNLIINRELNGSQAWNIINVLEILKNEISARENTRSNHENFRNPITANTLYANGTDNRFNNKFNQNLSQNNFRNQNFSRN